MLVYLVQGGVYKFLETLFYSDLKPRKSYMMLLRRTDFAHDACTSLLSFRKKKKCI
jgi:hypothetical protein